MVNSGGLWRLINFYSSSTGTNIVIAGNYFGVAIDGVARCSNSGRIVVFEGTPPG